MEKLDYEDDKKKPDDNIKKGLLRIFKPRSRGDHLNNCCWECKKHVLQCTCG